MPKAIVIPANSEPYELMLSPTDYPAEMHRLVDGYLEHVATNNSHDLFFNDDGKGRGLPANTVATRLAAGIIAQYDYIAGDAVLLGKADAYGESTDVTIAADALAERDEGTR